MTTPTPTTETTITTPPTITQAEEDKQDQKKLAQAKTSREKANKENEKFFAIACAANVNDIRNMPKTDAPLTMGPDRKRGIVVDDDMRAALKTGDYVKVELDSSPGMNRPEGYGQGHVCCSDCFCIRGLDRKW